MKKYIKHFVAASLIMGTVLTASPASARGTEPEAVVTFNGYKNNQPVYVLNVKNPDNDKISIIIRDQDGNVLHEEVAQGTTITKQYLFYREEIGNKTLYFEVARYSDPMIARIKVNGKS